MNKDEFQRRISELAVIKPRKPARRSTDPRIPKETVIEVDEFGEEIEVTREVKQENDTLGFDLVRIKYQPKACELGCGKIVEGQHVQITFNTYPYEHWRKKCSNCGCHLGPDGRTLYENGIKAQAAFYKEKYGRE